MAASKFPEFERVHVITMDRYQENIVKFLKVNRDELKKCGVSFCVITNAKFTTSKSEI